MTALQNLLATYRNAAVTEREKGTYFEELIVCYLRNEATYRDLYCKVWTWSDWAKEQGLDARDTGIDLVAQTHGTSELHAIQCKFYSEDYRVQKADIDSFFTASGKKPFTHRVIVTTTTNWSEHANDALQDQQPPVSKIDLHDLESSQIEWEKYHAKQAPNLKSKKTLRDHQVSALAAVETNFATAERGKLIMACGTGKTFTSLKIAERLVGAGKRVLFLVPSLSLLSQTLTEWTQESTTPLHSFAVCSDGEVGKKRKKDDDVVQTFVHELRYPATTNPARLAEEMTKRHDTYHMSVVFSTYHSIDVISRAQKEFALADFDLIICDEAHRTTGATFGDDDESNFVKVHDASFIKSLKRLYMTATPRIYGEMAKAKADTDNVALCSMDDESLYGKELFVINFSEAVRRELLVDYKVLVLAVSEDHVSAHLQKLLKSEDNQLKVDDAAKIIGCWKGLSKQDTQEDLVDDRDPMRRAVAFCQVIENTGKSRTHKVSSVNIANMFSAVVEAYKKQTFEENLPSVLLNCEAEHVDGGMNASEKEAKLSWLKEDLPENTCRILSNVRCLSEGVDVPALDAVLFLTPRNSQVDVVQSVGRVMRLAEGKKRGYVILPVVIPSGMEAHEALDDNVTYKVVWQVLQALRSHDDRFDAMVNKMDLELNKSMLSKMEVIAVSDKLNKKETRGPTGKTANKDAGKGKFGIGEAVTKTNAQDQGELQFEIGEIEKAIYAKVVQKCGNRHHWADWANDIAKIARTHISRITEIIADELNTAEREAFFAFANELRDDLNDSITDAEVIEMLAQHLITKPVFDALFSGYSFATNNPMSCAMQNVLDILQEHRLDKEADTLERFYDSVKMRAEGIEDADGKQKIIVELYDKFFRNAFPRMTERLGIVYTPVEVVDFIIHSVDHILQNEFGQSLGSDGVHIIDPFTGTGTFITRLLQSGLISKEQLQVKYKGQIHANEIVLLAYYIAAINIEAVYHSIVGGDYVPFEGICLTDTFQMYEKEDLVDQLLVDNSARRKKQKALDIRVIIGNPPYSVGQKNGNDDNENVKYPSLDSSLRASYVKYSSGNPRSLYDSYIRAIRWASDRLGQSGVIGFISGNGFIDKPAMDGMRRCLAEEFGSIYILNLRGDVRKNMLSKGRAKEGGNIFGSGSMSGITISFFVKDVNRAGQNEIYYHDIGDDLSTEAKLDRLAELQSIFGLQQRVSWEKITPNESYDWINKRDSSFKNHIKIGEKKDKSEVTIFHSYSSGLKTCRDSWCYSFSKKKVLSNMESMITFYNSQLNLLVAEKKNNSHINAEDYIDTDESKISWSYVLKNRFIKGVKGEFVSTKAHLAQYRPYVTQWLYFDRMFNENQYLVRQLFPNGNDENLVICVSGVGARSGFSALIVKFIPDLHTLDTGQCFPLYIYEAQDKKTVEDDIQQGSLLEDIDGRESESDTVDCQRKDAITDEGLAHFLAAYPDQAICKEDVFYYVYGLLHSADYRDSYADNLTKELPRIPCVKAFADFQAFSQAGRNLADLHLNYETVEMYPAQIAGGALLLKDSDYRVEKMKYGKKGKDKDLTTLIYNDKITVTGIPIEAYEYVINGKPALDWVVERQCISTHKDSGIINDANDWASETMQNSKYPLELFLRIVTVSLETMKIVNKLPCLNL